MRKEKGYYERGSGYQNRKRDLAETLAENERLLSLLTKKGHSARNELRLQDENTALRTLLLILLSK